MERQYCPQNISKTSRFYSMSSHNSRRGGGALELTGVELDRIGSDMQGFSSHT
jgi:hypothetical protein